MVSFTFWMLLLSFSIPCSCDLRILSKDFGEKINHRILGCLNTLLDVTDWPVHNFLIISTNSTAVDDDFLKRHLNFGWKLYSSVNNNLTGFFNVIIFAKNFHNLDETLRAISIQRINSKSRFVITLSEDYASLDEIKRSSTGVTAAMWKLDKTQVVYLVPCEAEVFLMTYFPFAKDCQVGELEVLDTWRGENFEKRAQLFPERMLDIRDCVQNHSIIFAQGTQFQVHKGFTETGDVTVGGVAGKLMNIVAERMNMKLHLLPEEPESWDLLLEQVLLGESLFSIGGNIPTAHRLEKFDLDSHYMEESFGFGYLTDGLDVSWKNFVWPLSPEVWGYIGCTVPLFYGLIYLVNRYYRLVITPDNLKILDTFGISLGSARLLPQSYFGRYLFGMWIAYSYLMNTSYNSELVSFLTTPNEKRVINTLEDLLANGMDFGGGTWHRNFYHDPSDPVMMKIYDNFKVWPLNDSEYRLLSGQCASGVLGSYRYTFNGSADQQLRMLKEKAFIFHVPIFMRRGSPFTIGVYRYTSKAVQSGLVDYWIRHYTRNPRFRPIGAKSRTVISTRHLRGILYLYSAGLFCSTVVFIGELIVHTYFPEHRRN